MPSYETITLNSGEYRNLGQLGDGETFEDVLIDCTAPNSAFKLNAVGDGWTIRNVGVLGAPWRNDGRDDDHLFNVAGDGTVENLFIDARRRDGGQLTSMGGVRAKRSHSGTVVMRNTCIAGMGNNASYASSAGKNGGGNGVFIYDSCYHRDNTPSNFRPGTSGSEVRNCVSISDDPECRRGEYKGTRQARGIRGVWVNHCPNQTIRNTSFYQTSRDCSSNGGFGYKQVAIEARCISKGNCGNTGVTIENCRFGGSSMNGNRLQVSQEGCSVNVNGPSVGSQSGNPTTDVLQNGGVPLNPEMAARGERSIPPGMEYMPLGGFADGAGNGGGQQPERSTVTVTNDGSAQTDYTAVVDGEIVSTVGFGTGDEVDTSGQYPTASGFVNGGEDQFSYTGCIRSFDYDGPTPDLTVDGQTVTPSGIVDCTDDGGNGGQEPRQSGLGNVALLGGLAAVAWANSDDLLGGD